VKCDRFLVAKRHQPSVEVDLAVQKERLGVLDWDVFLFVVLSNEPEGIVVAFESTGELILGLDR